MKAAAWALLVLAGSVRAETVTWTPAMTDTAGRPLPGDQVTQIRTGDCAGRTYADWGKYGVGISGAVFELPGFQDCECVMARTVVPSFPEATRRSPWVEVQKCTGAAAGICHQ